MSEPVVFNIRGVSIGEGVPKICVPVMGAEKAAVLESLRTALAVQPDILEWRIDYLTDCTPEAVAALLQDVRAAAGEKPLLVTFRTKYEGGQQSISGLDYAKLLAAVINTGLADLLDMEWAMFARAPQVGEVRLLAQQKGIPVIYSYHNFNETPSREELLKKLRFMVLRGCEIPKIAVMPRTPEDVLTLLSATAEMKRHHPGPIITMSMGQLGMISRLCGESFGSAITFGSAQAASAPGQIPAQQLCQVLALLHNGAENGGN